MIESALSAMSDFRETARVSAIVSRRRQQIVRLEETLHRVRLQLTEDEQRLRELQSKHGGKKAACIAAGRALRNCAQNGDADDSVCGDAARVLANCRKR